MAAIMSPASSSTQRTHRSSSVGRGTKQSRCGTCQTANASRLSPDIGEPPLSSVASLPRSAGERRRRPLLTQFKTQKQCPDQRREILVRRYHARFMQRGTFSKRQQRSAVGCGNGQGAQEARGPQVTSFCAAYAISPAKPLKGLGFTYLITIPI